MSAGLAQKSGGNITAVASMTFGRSSRKNKTTLKAATTTKTFFLFYGSQNTSLFIFLWQMIIRLALHIPVNNHLT
jgi:hypothetical protein